MHENDVYKCVAVAVLVCAGLASGMVRANGSEQAGARWPGKLYVWHYNPAHRPSWLSPDESFRMISDAALRWQACGVQMRYGGRTEKLPGAMDGVNVVGWSPDGKEAHTSGRARRDGAALEADIVLDGRSDADYRAYGLAPRRELSKSIVHEFGHALGLGHSARAADAMSVGATIDAQAVLPSLNDITRCRALYPGKPAPSRERLR